MNSDSADEDESMISMLFDENSEDYVKECFCDVVVHDVVPRLQRLQINDGLIQSKTDEQMDLQISKTIFSPSVSMNSTPISENCCEIITAIDLSKGSFPMLACDMSYETSMKEVTKVANANENPLPRSDESTHDVQMNMESYLEDFVCKSSMEAFQMCVMKLNQEEKSDGFENNHVKIMDNDVPLDLSKSNTLEYKNEQHQAFVSVVKDEQGLIEIVLPSDPSELIDFENGERSTNGQKHNSENKVRRTSSDTDSSYSTGASSDGPSIIIDTPPGSCRKASFDDTVSIVRRNAEIKSRKTAVVDSPFPEMNVRQRRFSIFQSPIASNGIDAVPTSKANSSDEDLRKSNETEETPVDAKRKCSKAARSVAKAAILQPTSVQHGEEKQTESTSDILAVATSKANSSSDEDRRKSKETEKSPGNTKRKCRKAARSVARAKNLQPANMQNDEKKLPSPGKRRKVSVSDERDLNLRKRCKSEHDGADDEAIVAIRSRSLSSGLQKSRRISITNPPTENSVSPTSRKRTSSEQNVNDSKSSKLKVF